MTDPESKWDTPAMLPVIGEKMVKNHFSCISIIQIPMFKFVLAEFLCVISINDHSYHVISSLYLSMSWIYRISASLKLFDKIEYQFIQIFTIFKNY